MKYKVRYTYRKEEYGYEGEEVSYVTTSTEYFDSYDRYEDFMQVLDMASDPDARIVEDVQCSDVVHSVCALTCKVLLKCHMWHFEWARKLFYYCVEKGLMCPWGDFGNTIWSSWDYKVWKNVKDIEFKEGEWHHV